MEKGEIIYSIEGKKKIFNNKLWGYSFLLLGVLCFLGLFAILPDTTRENNNPAVYIFSFGVSFIFMSFLNLRVKTPKYIVFENGILISDSSTQNLPKEGLFISFNDIKEVRLSEDNSKIFLKARDEYNRLHLYNLVPDDIQLLYQWVEYALASFLEKK